MQTTKLDDTFAGYDVIIVGCGSAGCIAGHFLDNKSMILAIDERKLPRNKPCGGILVKESQIFLKGMNAPDSFYEEPKELDLFYSDWVRDEEKKVEKGFININRKKFDEWLLSLLSKGNVHLADETRLIDLNQTKDKKYYVALLDCKGYIKPIIVKHVIGADGAFSKVRSTISKEQIRYYVAMQETIKNPGITDSYFIYDDGITDFYSWIIPKGDSLIIGSALPPYEAKEIFNIFKGKIRRKMNISGEGTTESTIITRPKNEKQILLGKGNILLAGEAAGLISPSSAEGISFALESGKKCAQAINKKNENTLNEYNELCKPLLNRLKPKFEKSKKIEDPEKRSEIMQK